jgi:hypothetical protein
MVALGAIAPAMTQLDYVRASVAPSTAAVGAALITLFVLR